MTKILMCWELRAGQGHLGRLAPIAKHLRECGYDIDLASRILRPVRSLFSDAVNSIYQAPIQLSLGGEGIFPTLGFAHVLNNVGYASVDSLEPLVRA